MKTVKRDFENLVHQGMKSYGLDELSSKLLAMLYSEPDPLTLEELTLMTGYGFSAVSASMKLLSGVTLVNKTRKAGSKKLYFSVKKDMLTMTIDAIKSKNEFLVVPALKDLPAMLEICENSQAKESEELLKLINQYYQQMLALNLIFKNSIELTQNIQKEINKE